MYAMSGGYTYFVTPSSEGEALIRVSQGRVLQSKIFIE